MKKYLPGFLLLIATACTNYNEEELYPKKKDPCDIGTVTYSQTVRLILDQKCKGCHSTAAARGGVILDNYTGVHKAALNGRLVGSITHAPGFTPMPPNGVKLPECDIAHIKAWVVAGAPNN